MRSINLSIIVKDIVQLPKTTSPKKLFNSPKTTGPKEIFFLPCKKWKRKKNWKEKKYKNYWSSRIGSIGVVIAASSITSAMFVASSVTFSTVASEGRLDICSFSTSSITKPERSKSR